MTYILSTILLFMNFIYAFTKRHNKFIAFVLLLFAWILFWGNTLNPDYLLYKEIYCSNANYITNNLEIGYILIIKIFNFLGFNYQIFLLIISLFGFILINNTIKRYCINYNYIYLLYFIFPYFFDIIQIRNFLIMALFVYSTKYLVDGKLKSKVKYCIIIIFASTIHISAIAFLPMMMISVKKNNNLVRLIVLFSFMFSILILLNNKEIPFINEINTLIGIKKISLYTGTKTNYGFILFWLLQTMSYIMVYISYKLFKKYNIDMAKVLERKFIYIVYWINTLAFIYFPIYIINSNFTRLMRNILLLNYIIIAITNEVISDRREKRIYNILVVAYVFFMILIQLLPYTDEVIKLILDNNFIL